MRRRRKSGHVLVFHTGRSGSTLLGDLMDQHPEVVWGGEVFEMLLRRAARRQQKGIDSLYDYFDLADFVRAVRRRMQMLAGDRIYGLEVQGYQLDMMRTDIPQLLSELTRLGFNRFVVLKRLNPMRQIASHLVALARGAHHIESGRSVAPIKISVDPERVYLGHRVQPLRAVLDGYDQFWESVHRSVGDRHCLALTYELDIEENPLRAYAALCNHLGLTPAGPDIRLSKTTVSPVPEVISNIDELNAYFASIQRSDLIVD